MERAHPSKRAPNARTRRTSPRAMTADPRSGRFGFSVRSERELKAAATRALFAELWESGVTKQSELVLRLGHSRRNVQRLSEEWKSGRMAGKIATDRG